MLLRGQVCLGIPMVAHAYGSSYTHSVSCSCCGDIARASERFDFAGERAYMVFEITKGNNTNKVIGFWQ